VRTQRGRHLKPQEECNPSCPPPHLMNVNNHPSQEDKHRRLASINRSVRSSYWTATEEAIVRCCAQDRAGQRRGERDSSAGTGHRHIFEEETIKSLGRRGEEATRVGCKPSEVDDNGDSLRSTKRFDRPAGPPPKKPLLALSRPNRPEKRLAKLLRRQRATDASSRKKL
jgi:hypothetical protein